MIIIREIHVESLCYDWSIGITRPKFAVLENNTQAIVKVANGPEGNLVLFNEYFCYRLALLLNIPMPHSGICLVDLKTNILVPGIACEENYGKGFYSEYRPKTTKLLQTIISCMKNKEDFIKVLLFDNVVFNTDRNEGNLLVEYYKNNISLLVIDHSHVFINQAIWDAECLNRAIKENDLKNTKVMDYNKTLYDMFFRSIAITEEILESTSVLFRQKINENILLKIIEEIPDEWKPSQKDLNSLVKYIMYRVDNLDTIVSTIINSRR